MAQRLGEGVSRDQQADITRTIRKEIGRQTFQLAATAELIGVGCGVVIGLEAVKLLAMQRPVEVADGVAIGLAVTGIIFVGRSSYTGAQRIATVGMNGQNLNEDSGNRPYVAGEDGLPVPNPDYRPDETRSSRQGIIEKTARFLSDKIK